MSDSDKQASNDKAVPFFARYLEGQFCEDLSEEEMENVHGGSTEISDAKGGIVTTLKYPSDNEEGGSVITKRHPSDKDDCGGGISVTRKYPSDNEDAVTLKYPSDGDDDIIAIDTVE
ncbi:microviridin/marinostatin family tricyclic proteinase inhibitor [Scytonema tolypothrichoides VB-61278]|nr:microviridin/marinostatin family tricyclic proteinase inhibitor [Scytonema tolypothrichoides VB-61278]